MKSVKIEEPEEEEEDDEEVMENMRKEAECLTPVVRVEMKIVQELPW